MSSCQEWIFKNLKEEMFRFIHTADIHLDSPLKSLALRDPQIADVVGGATRRTLEKIIDLCLDERVDALIIAGDLYDGDLRCMKTATFLTRQMRRLYEGNVRVFLIRGNHDSESSITKHLDFPPNVHVFKGHGGVEELRECGVAIHGVSFTQSHVAESLLHKYKQPIAGLMNIGIMHTSLAGAAGHDVYAPCSVSDLVAHGFDYWALGHIHQRHIHAETPFVVMPGIPQGRDIGESGPKSVTLVEISDKNIRIDERVVADSAFQRIQVDLSAITEWSVAFREVQKSIEEIQKSTQANHVICRIILSGKSPLYWRIRRDADLFEAEVYDLTQQLKGVFVDGVENALQPLDSRTDEANPVDELETLMTSMTKDHAFCADAASFLEAAISKMPPELRDLYGVDEEGRKKILQNLLLEGIHDVIAQLKNSHELEVH